MACNEYMWYSKENLDNIIKYILNKYFLKHTSHFPFTIGNTFVPLIEHINRYSDKI